MLHRTSPQHKRVGAITTALLATLALGLTGSTVALAAEGNINPDTPRSLTIHKEVTGSQTTPGTPSGSAVTNGTPVNGVEFTIYPITSVNLAQNTGWSSLENFAVPADACTAGGGNTPALTIGGTAATFGSPQEQLTANGGLAAFTGLDLAAYLVCETDAPSNVVERADPFIVTVPSAAAATGGWIYDVHAYPKNVLTPQMTKTVDTVSTLAGTGTIRYNIDTVLPTLATGDYFTDFRINDPMGGGLVFSSTPATVVTLTPTTGPVQTLTVTDDYNLTPNSSGVWITFTVAGLTKLNAAPGGTVRIALSATTTVPANGLLSNTANLYMNIGDTPPVTPPPVDPPENPVPSTKSVTYAGNLVITKVDSRNSDAPLSGATFQLFPAETPFPAGQTACAAVPQSGAAAITVAGANSFTTDSTGAITVGGIFVDHIDNVLSTDTTTVPANSTRCYVLVETAAPLGYALDTTPRAVTVAAGTASGNSISIANTRTDLPDLPLTGAAGQMLLIGGGAVLLVLAVGSVLVIRRKQRVTNI